jgi:choline/glycine/proline betaine transport protein
MNIIASVKEKLMFDRLAKALGLSAVPQIFFPAAALAIVFVLFAIPFNKSFALFFGELGRFTFYYFGWFYVLSVSGLLVFLLWIVTSRYGGIRLGSDNQLPEYSTLTWFVMLFAAGIGTILMFWGVAEPLSHYMNPPFVDVEPESRESAKAAMNIALYHFGLHTWTIFTLPAVAIGYSVIAKVCPCVSAVYFTACLASEFTGPWVGLSILLRYWVRYLVWQYPSVWAPCS